MKRRLRTFVKKFAPKTYSEPESTRISRVLQVVCLAILVGVIPSTIHNWVGDRTSTVFTLLLLLACAGAALLINYVGKPDVAAKVITFGALLCTTLLIWVSQAGFHDTALLIFPGILVLAAMLLSFRFYFAVTVLTILVVCLITIAEISGRLPSTMRAYTSYTNLIDAVAILAVTAVCIGLLVGDLRATLARVQESREALAEGNLELARQTEQLKTSEERFRSVIELAADAIFLCDSDGKINGVNQSAIALSGYTRDELRGKRIGMLLPDELGQTLSLVDSSVERTITRKDGTKRIVEISCRPMPDGTHQCFFHDVSDRRRAEDQLRQAQKLESVGRLAGGVAHDFNNLLTVINGYASLLISELQDNEMLRTSAEQIAKAGERAADLTGQLLAFSRKQIIQPRALDFNGLVEENRQMIQSLIGESIELATRLDPALALVNADQGQMHQVLMNLVVNARDGMPDGGKLFIETANCELNAGGIADEAQVSPGAYVLFMVRDTGLGMDEEGRVNVFEPFFTTKRNNRGFGLGLSTVYGIVRQSLGGICVETEPGKGTAFKIYLPRLPGHPKPEGRAATTQRHWRGSETILLVEDQDEVRDLTAKVLTGSGYHVLQASGPAEAIRLVEENKITIHLLLTDVVMPGMTGRDLALQLKPSRPEMKVLYISGYSDAVIARQGVLDPGVAFLPKPFTPAKLAETVREILEK